MVYHEVNFYSDNSYFCTLRTYLISKWKHVEKREMQNHQLLKGGFSSGGSHLLTSTPCYSTSNSATDYRAVVVNLLRRKQVTFFKNQWCHAKNWRKWWLGRVKTRSIVFLSLWVIWSSSCLIWGFLLLLLFLFYIYIAVKIRKGLFLTVC